MNRKVVRFGDNIKILRNRNNLTQDQLADIFPVTRQTVSAWENNVSSPDINILAKLSEMFNVTADELIFGKVEKNIEPMHDSYSCYEESDYIRDIKKKGFYDITEEDIEVFFSIIYIRFARIMGIAMELKERGYQIVSVYSNGFSIYFKTDEEAEGFANVLYDVIDAFMHHEVNKTAVSYSEAMQEKVEQIEISVIKETHKNIFGSDIDEMYYWIDEYDRIRGYGITEEECQKQAQAQGCDKYSVLHE